MEPSVVFLSPWNDPPNTLRATETRQMFDTHLSIPSLHVEYFVGRDIFPKTFKLFIRNKTLNADLDINILLPSHLFLNDDSQIILERNKIKYIQLSFNEGFIKEYSTNSNQVLDRNVELEVMPINFEGPIYVRTNLLDLANGGLEPEVDNEEDDNFGDDAVWLNGVTGKPESGAPPIDWKITTNGYWYPPKYFGSL